MRLRGLLKALRRKLVPWDPEWRRHRGEKRAELPPSGERLRRARESEEAVARHLWAEGYQILGRNVRGRYGELDIVAELAGRVHCVEVRSYLEGNPRPSGALTRAKRASLFRAAHAFRNRRRELAEHGLIIEVAEVCYSRDGRRLGIHLVALDFTDMAHGARGGRRGAPQRGGGRSDRRPDRPPP